MKVENIGKNGMKVLALVYVLALIYVTMMSPERYLGYFEYDNINMVPLSGKWYFFDNFSSLSVKDKIFIIKEIVGNILLLLPFPWFFHTFFGTRRNIVIAGIIVFLVLCIESLQYALHIGTFDIDDIILNITGGFAGIFLFDVLCKKK